MLVAAYLVALHTDRLWLCVPLTILIWLNIAVYAREVVALFRLVWARRRRAARLRRLREVSGHCSVPSRSAARSTGATGDEGGAA